MYWCVSVVEHKTGSMGPAKLIIDKEMRDRLNSYVRHIRPALMEPGTVAEELFLVNGKKIFGFYA